VLVLFAEQLAKHRAKIVAPELLPLQQAAQKGVVPNSPLFHLLSIKKGGRWCVFRAKNLATNRFAGNMANWCHLCPTWRLFAR